MVIWAGLGWAQESFKGQEIMPDGNYPASFGVRGRDQEPWNAGVLGKQVLL